MNELKVKWIMVGDEQKHLAYDDLSITQNVAG